MRVMTAEIIFHDIPPQGKTFNSVNAIRIESGFKTLTNRAEITLPRNIHYHDNKIIKELFKRGHRVTIKFGYDGDMPTQFEGYITTVDAGIPLIIKCEDEMWKLKQIPVNYSNKSVTLEQLLKDICPGYQIDALEGVPLGSVRFSNTTVAKVLEKLQTDFGLYSYMKGKKLISGKYYSADGSGESVKLRLERDVAETSLKYRDADEIQVKIKARSIQPKGGKQEYEYGEDGGEVLTLTYFGLTADELKSFAKRDYDERKVNGLTGTITAFGSPNVEPGMKVKLSSSIFPEKDGTYYIDTVNKTFDTGGIRQSMTLDGKVSD